MKQKLLKGLCYILLVVVFVFVYGYFFVIGEISGKSMQNTYQDGDRVLCSELHHLQKDANVKLNYNDVVLVHIPNEDIIKRVIALPGDTIEIIDGIVLLNDKEVDQSFIKNGVMKGSMEKQTIEEGKIFVMGDNRDISLDSRIIGQVPYEDVYGKVLFRFTPFKTLAVLIVLSIVVSIIITAVDTIIDLKLGKLDDELIGMEREESENDVE